MYLKKNLNGFPRQQKILRGESPLQLIFLDVSNESKLTSEAALIGSFAMSLAASFGRSSMYADGAKTSAVVAPGVFAKRSLLHNTADKDNNDTLRKYRKRRDSQRIKQAGASVISLGSANSNN